MSSVKNINGTSNHNCKCHSRLKHWERFSRKTFYFCAAYGCTEKDNLIGTLVQKTTSDADWYIIPFCYKHNQSKGELKISAFTTFITANKKETCEKTVSKKQIHE